MNGGEIAEPPPREDDAAWEDPPRRVETDAAPTLMVDGFEGPLDFLVEQCRAGRIDLARLPIAELVDAFANALLMALEGEGAPPTVLARWSAWLVMVADLALLRSRLLLPNQGSGERSAGEEAEALRHEVHTRAVIAAATDWFERRDQLGRDVWSRGRAEAVTGSGGRGSGITELLRACLVALRVPDGDGGVFRVVPPLWSAADAALRIRALLTGAGKGGASLARFLPDIPTGSPDYELRNRAAIAVTFTVGLEMVREGSLLMEQSSAFASLTMTDGIRPCPAVTPSACSRGCLRSSQRLPFKRA